MRWPLRNQILTRMLLLLAITIVAFTYASIHSIIAANRETELKRLQRIVELMTTSQFPLTPPVLDNMNLLSGAEFAFVQHDGKMTSKTKSVPTTFPEFEIPGGSSQNQSPPLAIESDGLPYYHTAITGVRDNNNSATSGVLHILVPRQSERATWITASKTPLATALFVLPLALILSFALANQVTQPLSKLNQRVQEIAEGEVGLIPDVRRNDEIRDLNESINEMSLKLQDHEVQLRNNERLRTMVQFGNGVAHHLRNSATGCKMAIELLTDEEQKIGESENYHVAIRQLGLMDNYIKKFLLLSKPTVSDELDPVSHLDFGDVLESVVFLVRPSAEHLGVDLSIQSNCDGTKIRMAEEDAQQLMMNLITNAIRAASENSANRNANEQGLVSVDLHVKNGFVRYRVTDNGAGPPEKIAKTIFDPFVTGSKEGTGLGLSLVKAIADRANGAVRWSRKNQMTTFCFETGTQLEDEAV